MDTILTVAECAARLGISQDFIRDRIKTGKLRAIRALGRGYRIRPEWLDAFVASLETTREAPTPFTAWSRSLSSNRRPCKRPSKRSPALS